MFQSVDLTKHKTTYVDLAYDHLLKAILSHDLRAGDRLRPQDLATALGLSPTPIKQALARLVGEGLVEHRQGKGPYVAVPSVSEVVELHEAVLMCEVHAVRRGLPRVDDESLARMRELNAAYEGNALIPVKERTLEIHRKAVDDDGEFHLLLMSLCPNEKIQKWHRQLNAQLRSVRYIHVLGLARKVGITEHSAIVEALERRDAEAASERVQLHIEGALSFFIKRAREVGLQGTSTAPA